MIEAIFYESREWGFVEVKRMQIEDNRPFYHFANRPSMQAVIQQGVMPISVQTATMETFHRVGRLPTGEIMFVKI